MDVHAEVRAGCEAFACQRWTDARDHLRAASDALAPDDLDGLAVTLHLLGEDADGQAVRERAHHAHLAAGQPLPAARSAVWLALSLFRTQEPGRAGGWLARADELTRDHPDAVERGWALLPPALAADPATAIPLLRDVLDLADAHHQTTDPDHDLRAMARLGLGTALLTGGQADEAVAQFDQAMALVLADQVGPLTAGIVRCGVLEGCHRLGDIHRAREWTAALTGWCDRQPDLVPFRGQCLVHRSQVLQRHGDWDAAMATARQACDLLGDPPPDPAIGEAHYQQAELHRLRGEDADADRHYRAANRWTRSPQPGLALLRLQQGQGDTARTALSRALRESPDPPAAAQLRAAQVQVLLETGDTAQACDAVEHLTALADQLTTSIARADAAECRGAVLLAEGDPGPALADLREALVGWVALDLPFEAARTRLHIATACRALGDEEGCGMELDAARDTLTALGARPALTQLDQLRGGPPTRPGNLTDREVEVLQLVAAGQPNKAIAEALVISEHTVARHLQHIYAKLDVGSRTAAAAFAHTHDLV